MLRRIALVGLLMFFPIILAALLGAAWAVIPCPPGVTARNFLRIREGMTLEEVEALLGRKGTFILATRGNHARTWTEGRCKVILQFRDTASGYAVELGTCQQAGKAELQVPKKRR